MAVPQREDATRRLTTIKRASSAREAAALLGVPVHDQRHSAALTMVDAGVDFFAVDKVLDHASGAFTARYSHLRNDTLLAAIEVGAAELGAARYPPPLALRGVSRTYGRGTSPYLFSPAG